MKAINQATLIDTINAVKGATFATIITETDARLKKTGNPFGPVRKISRVNVCLGFQYEAAVNRQRTREDSEADFEARPRQWGERISAMLIGHKGRTYLETKVQRALETSYIDATGKELSKEDVSPFLPARSKSRQEVADEVIVRDYALDSIRSLAFGGETYLLTQATAPVAVKIARTQPVTK